MARCLRRRARFGSPRVRGERLPAIRWTASVALLLLLPVAGIAQSDEGTTAVPRTPWGHPDLQGVWDYRTATPFERPEELGTTTVVEGADAEALIAWRHADDRAFEDRLLGADWSDHLEVGLAEGTRTSLIVDPANGRLPRLPNAEDTRAELLERWRAAHGPEDRLRTERCIMSKSAP